MPRPTLIITGASGFIGSKMVRRLANCYDVHALCRTPPATLANLSGVTWTVMDLTRGINEKQLPDRVYGVIHLAQSEAYRNFPKDTEDMFSVNVSSTASLLDYARRVDCQRFLLASTGIVYHPFEKGMGEDAPLAPKDYYGATKLAAETLMWPYQDIMNTLAVRLFYPFGAGQVNRLVPQLAERVRNGEAISVGGQSGDGVRLTPTFIDDVIDVVIEGLEQGWSGPLNVASPNAVSIRELAESIGVVVGRSPVMESQGGDEPAPIIPDLSRLESLYDMSRFRNLEDCLALALSDGGG
jgi:nucleoside-diphosphate-sugar epimerase